MDTTAIITKRLMETKQIVSEIGWSYVIRSCSQIGQATTEDMALMLEPFVLLEEAFNNCINKIQSHDYSTVKEQSG